MNNLLLKENLDVKLTPYRILATSQKYKCSILAYLRTHNPAMDTHIRSCAGYCVITYILGVGIAI